MLTPILRIFWVDLDEISQKSGHWHGWHRHCYSSSHPIPYLVEGASPTPTDIRKPRPLTSASPLLGVDPIGISACLRLLRRLCRLRRCGGAFEIEIQLVLVGAVTEQFGIPTPAHDRLEHDMRLFGGQPDGQL